MAEPGFGGNLKGRRRSEPGFGGALSAVADDNGGSPNLLQRVLSTLAVPGRAVTSVVKELDDLIVTPFERGKGDTGGGASLGDILKNYRDGVGAGQLTHAGEENKWLGRAIGLAGDVALDPLSYLTVGASKAGSLAGRTLTKDEVARGLLKLAEETGDEALVKTAAKVAKSGTGALTAEEAAQAGIRQGARIGLGNAKVTIPGSGAVARGVNAVTSPLKTEFTDRLLKIAATIDPEGKLSRTGLAHAERIGDMGALRKLMVMDARRMARGEARALASGARRELAELGKVVQEADKPALREALLGAQAATPEVAQAVGLTRFDGHPPSGAKRRKGCPSWRPCNGSDDRAGRSPRSSSKTP